MQNILRVDMTSGSVRVEELPVEYKALGGRGLSSRLLLDEVPAQCDPLGPANKLVFTCGLLAGTYLSSANRISVGAKSPLTKGIKESNAGGVTALRLAQLGFRAVVIEGQANPKDFYYLIIDNGSYELRPASELIGKGCFETAQILHDKWGAKADIALIGPAGEQRMNLAGIAHTDVEGLPTRYSARGGLGAVMGSKGLKAIVILHPNNYTQTMVDSSLWKQTVIRYSKTLKSMEQTAVTMPKYGTALTMELIDSLGAVPTRNFSSGSFEKASEIGGVRMREVIMQRGGEGTPTHACMPGCLVKCSNRFADQAGKLVNTPMEYENLAFLGANLGIGDLDEIAKLNFLCNDLGVDTIETGAAIAVTLEAGLGKFGDSAAVEDLMLQIGRATDLGRILGQGAVVTGQHFGIKRVMAFKGQTIGAYDPRSLKVNGVTYATSPMGGDHTAGNGLALKIDHRDPKGKVEISFNLQITSAWVDTLGLCTFVRGTHAVDSTIFPDLLKARFGGDWTPEELEKLGRRIIGYELEFNRKAGLKDTEVMPEFIKTEKLAPYDSLWDIPDEELGDIWKSLF